MSQKLWQPSKSRINNSNLFNYEKFVSGNYKYKFSQNYKKLLNWSLNNPKDFWNSLWNYFNVNGIKTNVFKLTSDLINSKFFINSKLNFAENVLLKNTNEKAITFISETGYREQRSWKELNTNIKKIITFYKNLNISEKDRVAAYTPNQIETVECFLGASALGAIWSSCSPDFGVPGLVERFSQIKPKILIVTEKYYYNGKEINIIERLPKILNKIKSIKKVLILNYPGNKTKKMKKIKGISFYYFADIKKLKVNKKKLKKFDFDHELAILYSSGTTGKPKCICHRSGGVLLQHLKEHQLHCDVKPGDNVFYFTTCGWMMWNWLVTSLASKASILLFDGFPFYKSPDLLLKIANKENVTLFGISAKYIDQLIKMKVNIKNSMKLKSLKTICSTGSPLSKDGFKYVYKKIKQNVHLASISGGTDIVSCFVNGNTYSPVYSGEIQSNGLGMDTDVFSEKGKSILNKKGELVCKSAFPSMPLKFWNDRNKIKYKNAYFSKFKNTWYHGDYAEKKKSGSYIIYGRSDATLNPGGVRLGTAEIYSVVEKFKEIKESIVVGQSWDNDVRIILFIIMTNKSNLNERLKLNLKKIIRQEASPRHVPSKIIEVKDIPRTKNGKIVEVAVKNIIDGNPITNLEALANPSALDEYKNINELKF